MTEIAAELLEDVKVDDYVQVRYGTDSDQTLFEGEIVKWTDNFLSLREEDGDIVKVRLDDNLRALKKIKPANRTSAVQPPIQQSVNYAAAAAPAAVKPQLTRQLVTLEQSQLYSITPAACIENAKKRIKLSDNSDLKRSCCAVIDSLTSAFKTNAVSNKYHDLKARLIQSEGACKSPDDYKVYCYLLGVLSFVAADYQYSIEPLVRAHEFLFAAYSANKGGLIESEKILTLCALLGKESTDINQYTSQICVERKDADTLKKLLEIYKDDKGMCEKLASCARDMFIAGGNALTVNITPYFTAYDAASQLLSDLPSNWQKSRSAASWFEEFSNRSFPKHAEEPQDKNFVSVIKDFKLDGKYGFIEPNEYFYISQVYDDTERGILLRKMLFLGLAKGLEVVFQRGQSQTQRGSTAAFAIELTQQGYGDALERIESADPGKVIQTGFVEAFYPQFMAGRIQSNGKTYHFKLNAIVDPWLKSYYENGWSYKEQDVTFEAQGNNAFNVCWLNPDEEDRTFFASDITSADLKRWESYSAPKSVAEKNKLPDDDPYSIYQYYDLPAPEETKKADIALLSWGGKSIMEKPLNDAVCAPVPPEISGSAKPIVPPSAPAAGSAFSAVGKYYADQARAASKSGDLSKAEHLFEKALQTGGFNEPVVCDYILLCIREEGRIDKALELLQEYDKQFSPEKLLTVSIQVYDKIKDYAMLIPLYEKGFRTSPTIMRKNHYIGRLIDACIKSSKYSEALSFCSQWEQFYAQNRFRAEAEKLKKAEPNIKRQKAICLYYLGETDKAKGIATELVRLNPADVVANSILDDTFGKETVLESEQSETVNSHDYEPDDSADEPAEGSQMSRFVRASVQKADIVSVLKTANVKDGHYVGTSQEGMADIDKLVNGRRISAKTRSDSLFVACKLLEQIEQHGDCSIKNTNRKYRYSGRAMASWGDFMVSQSSQLDTVRMAYLYALKVLTPTSRGAEQDWINSYNRYIKSYFLARAGSNSLEEYINQQNNSSSKDAMNTDIFVGNRIPKVLAPEFVVGVLMLVNAISSQPKTVSTFISELYNRNADLRDTVLCQLKYYFLDDERDVYTLESFSTGILKAASTLNQKQNELRSTLVEIGSTILIQPYANETIAYLENESWKNYLTATDFSRLNIICYKIIKRSQDYFNTGDFENRSDCLRAVLVEAQELLQIIQKEPTDISYDLFLPVLDQIVLRITEKQNDLYQVFLPKLSWNETIQPFCTPEGQIQVQLTLKNELNYQSADSVTIVNVFGPDIQWFSSVPPIQTLRGGDEVEIGILIAVNDMAKTTGSFAATIQYSYKCSDAPQNVIVKNQEEEFIFIVRDQNFVPLINPYSAYAGGKEMKDDDMFVGRSSQIELVLNAVCPQGTMNYGYAIAMYGQTRTGKSSLMYHLKNALQARYQDSVIIWNLENIGKIPKDENFFSNFLYTLSFVADRSIRKNPVISKKAAEIGLESPYRKIRQDPALAPALFDSYMSDLNEILINENKIIILMIDEFTYLHGDWPTGSNILNDFMKWWKAFVQQHCVFAILAGQDDMPEFIRSYQNEFAWMDLFRLNYLEERDAKDLSKRPLETANHREGLFRDDGSLHKLYTLTAGSAYLTIVLCAKLVNYLNEKGAYMITKGIINEFLRTRAFGPNGFLTEANFEAQLQERGHRELDGINHDILLSVARLSQAAGYADINSIECDGLSRSEIQTYVDRLVDRNVLVKEGRSQYWIQVKLLELWLINTEGK